MYGTPSIYDHLLSRWLLCFDRCIGDGRQFKAFRRRAEDFMAEAAQLEASRMARLEEIAEWNMVLAERKSVSVKLGNRGVEHVARPREN